MSTCRGCGAEVMRTRTTLDSKGDFAREVCPVCSPETFAGVKVTDPSDKRIWSGFEVEPDRYSSRDSENVVHAKDELRQDIWDSLNQDPEGDAVELKRRTRRTEPMTEEEIRRANNWAEQNLRPALEQAAAHRS